MNYRRQVDWLDTDFIESPFLQRVAVWLAAALAVSLIAFLCMAGYTRKEQVRGVLVPTGGLIEITPVSGGRITYLGVKEGDSVERNDLIAVISSERRSEILGQMLGEQLNSNEMDVHARALLSTEERQRSKKRLELLKIKLTQIGLEIGNNRKQQQNMSETLARLDPLEKDNYISGIEMQRMRDSLIALQSQGMSLERQRVDIREGIGEEEDRLRKIPIEELIEKRGLEQQGREIVHRMVSNDSQDSIEVRAPAPGVITNISVKINQTARDGDLIASFSPASSKLEARLLVPSSAVGFISVGQKVALKYDAYPSQIFGVREGHVAAISRSALTASQASGLFGSTISEPVFRVDVALQEQRFQTNGGTWNLRPGMQLWGDLQLERRTLISWIFASGRDSAKTKSEQ